MRVLYLLIVWIVAIAYIAMSLYFKDFLGRVLSAVMFMLAVTFSVIILST